MLELDQIDECRVCVNNIEVGVKFYVVNVNVCFHKSHVGSYGYSISFRALGSDESCPYIGLIRVFHQVKLCSLAGNDSWFISDRED